jgi:hypothetical protein
MDFITNLKEGVGKIASKHLWEAKIDVHADNSISINITGKIGSETTSYEILISLILIYSIRAQAYLVACFGVLGKDFKGYQEKPLILEGQKALAYHGLRTAFEIDTKPFANITNVKKIRCPEDIESLFREYNQVAFIYNGEKVFDHLI